MLLTLLLMALSSCTTGSSHNRGSLSVAMDKSRDGYEGEREVPDDEYPEPEEDEQEPEQREEDEEAHTDYDSYGGDSGPSTLLVMVRGGQSFLADPYFSRARGGEIMVGDSGGRWGVFLTGGFNILKTDPEHSVSESIEGNPLEFNAAVEGRFYPFKDLAYFSPYLLGRVGGFIMFWEFRNPLTSGDDTIHSDSLGGLILGTGAGMDLIRGERFRLGAAVIPEWYIYGDQTSQGFTNDFFGSQGLIRWTAEAGYRF